MGSRSTVDAKLSIRYVDSDEHETVRLIKDIKVNAETGCLDAYCENQRGVRTFRFARIGFAVVPLTGEVIENIWKHFGIDTDNNGQVKVEAAIWPIRNEVQALLYVASVLRGRAKRERAHIANFVLANTGLANDRAMEVDEYLKRLWIGDENGYRRSLQSISKSFRSQCRAVAQKIVRGSGRRPVTPKILDRIDKEFPLNGEGCWVGKDWPSLYEDDIESPKLDQSSESVLQVDEYSPIRWLLDGYKVELQILLAVAKIREWPSEKRWTALISYFKDDKQFSDEAVTILRRYTKSWGKDSEESIVNKCNLLVSSDVTRDQRVRLVDAIKNIVGASEGSTNAVEQGILKRIEIALLQPKEH
jgi:hypothetical protein